MCAQDMPTGGVEYLYTLPCAVDIAPITRYDSCDAV